MKKVCILLVLLTCVRVYHNARFKKRNIIVCWTSYGGFISTESVHKP